MVVIDPVARRTDGESVRIAKDVLCAGARAKICLADTTEELVRALVHRGRKRPVVIGDDSALVRVVGLLHREREPSERGPVAMVPVGRDVSLAHSLGVPTDTVAAARAVLDGAVRRLDLLVDESDGVVVGELLIPAPAVPPPTLWTACRTLLRTLTRPLPPPPRLRIEADGVLLADLDDAVQAVSVRCRAGQAEVMIRRAGTPVHTKALTVTVSGPDFRYRADGAVTGPVRTRTWTVREGAWSLMVPVGSEWPVGCE
jgi:hypothetical protein